MVKHGNIPQDANPAPRDSAAFEVRELLQHPGCPICALALRAVGRFMAAISYEQVNDPGLRDELRAAAGFCHTHAYRWLREARNVLGTALIYRDVLGGILSELEHSPQTSGALSALLRSRADARARRRGPCPACRVQREAEGRYLEALLQSLADPTVVAEFGRSSGLCRVHTRAAIRKAGPDAARIVERSRQVLDQLIRELSEVIRKEDYRFRAEPRTEGETTAPRRAVTWVVGGEGLTRPRDQEHA
jgi:Family of unknown function (DUF6062)